MKVKKLNLVVAVFFDIPLPNSPFAVLEGQMSRPENLDARFSKDFGVIPIPRRLRYTPDKPFHFGIVLNVSFGVASTFGELGLRFEVFYQVTKWCCSRGQFVLLSTSVK